MYEAQNSLSRPQGKDVLLHEGGDEDDRKVGKIASTVDLLPTNHFLLHESRGRPARGISATEQDDQCVAAGGTEEAGLV